MQLLLLAQPVTIEPAGTTWDLLLQHLTAAFIFSIIGVIFFAASLYLLERVTPYSLLHEIGEEHNIAAAVVIAAIVLGISMIIAAAIQG